MEYINKNNKKVVQLAVPSYLRPQSQVKERRRGEAASTSVILILLPVERSPGVHHLPSQAQGRHSHQRYLPCLPYLPYLTLPSLYPAGSAAQQMPCLHLLRPDTDSSPFALAVAHTIIITIIIIIFISPYLRVSILHTYVPYSLRLFVQPALLPRPRDYPLLQHGRTLFFQHGAHALLESSVATRLDPTDLGSPQSACMR